jgi:hypothetical protein
MLKDIIEKIENCKNNVNWEKDETWEILPIFSQLLDEIKNDLKKEAELQEEMIKKIKKLKLDHKNNKMYKKRGTLLSNCKIMTPYNNGYQRALYDVLKIL